MPDMQAALVSLAAAAAFFVFIHLAVAGTGLRRRLVWALGEGPYLGLFSLVSVAGIVWLAKAYNGALSEAYTATWGEIAGTRGLALVLVGLSFALGVAGILTKNPTAVRGEGALQEGAPVPALLRITRHPFLWGVVPWSVAHLLVNGDVPSLIFFGTFLVVALFGTVSIDIKRKRALGARWEAFAHATSNLPFAALVSGRAHLRMRELPWLKFLLGLFLFGAVLVAHEGLFGVSPLVGVLGAAVNGAVERLNELVAALH